MKLLEEMSWPEIEAGLKETQTVILPVGATEEHGPHLPIFTDTIQAVEVAKGVALNGTSLLPLQCTTASAAAPGDFQGP